MVVRQTGAPDTSEGVRTMVGGTVGKSGVRIVARFAYAAGEMGILARSRSQ
jgi:hypothetical protein